MKEGIHPNYETTTVVCSCGNRYETRSTAGGELHVELCNQCHPFFTGQHKFVDTGGRVQRFSDKFGAAANAVLEKEAAEKESRRKAAEEAAAKAKQERDARMAEKAERAAKHHVNDERRKPEVAAEATTEATAEATAEATTEQSEPDEPVLAEEAEAASVEEVEAAEAPVADETETPEVSE